jgi:hypothetical protein
VPLQGPQVGTANALKREGVFRLTPVSATCSGQSRPRRVPGTPQTAQETTPAGDENEQARHACGEVGARDEDEHRQRVVNRHPGRARSPEDAPRQGRRRTSRALPIM